MKTKFAVISLLSIAVSACGATGSNYRPITDGPVSTTFAHDLSDCKQVAEQKNYDNDETRNKVIGGSIIGGIVGAGESSSDALAGALVGGLAGGVKGAVDTKKERKQIVINCMAGRGHPVVG